MLTNKLRQYDAGILELGLIYNDHMAVPVTIPQSKTTILIVIIIIIIIRMEFDLPMILRKLATI